MYVDDILISGESLDGVRGHYEAIIAKEPEAERATERNALMVPDNWREVA